MPRSTKQKDKPDAFDLDSKFFATPWLRDMIYLQCDAKTIAVLRNVCKLLREEIDKHSLMHRYILVSSEHVSRYDSYTNLAIQAINHWPHYRYDSKANAHQSTDDVRRLQARHRRLDLAFLQKARHVVITGGHGIVMHENHPLCRGSCKCGYLSSVLCAMRSLCPNLRRLVMTYGPIGPASKAWGDGISTNPWYVDWTSDCQLTRGTRRDHIKLAQWQHEYPCAFALKADDPFTVIQDFSNARQLLLKARHAVEVKDKYVKTYQARRQPKPGKKYTRTMSDRELTQLRKDEKEAQKLRALMDKSISLHIGRSASARMQQFAQALEKQLEQCLDDRWHCWLSIEQGPNPFEDVYARFRYQNTQIYYSAANMLKMVIDDAKECNSVAPCAYEFVADESRWTTKAEFSVQATAEYQQS